MPQGTAQRTTAPRQHRSRLRSSSKCSANVIFFRTTRVAKSGNLGTRKRKKIDENTRKQIKTITFHPQSINIG